ncbi:NADP-dependent phosphogluconate dehydrogenase [Aquimarina sp. D1M17]|uniref:NADP-dependent phosphogluconate dehydrogenase n=1 Tax=Aquimarina acroporae TaxID=2937283 RepID=UPI0020BD618A|nr:NADP-dependent phosphogluconate dehydrogenase [Aquimarina acroporae]MCK8520293.1 NADP-dependent phosphogluconate dehydrogenase [Aquimarina acroporae]
MSSKPVYVVFGVSGSGKSTVGKALSEKLEIPFYDADDFHPRSNVEKMANGMALNDEDREPWLQNLSKNIEQWSKDGGGVLACSALKVVYRKKLESSLYGGVEWIFLEGSYDLIFNRLTSREAHFFPKELLDSQFETLETWERGITIGIDQGISNIINEIELKLKMQKSQIGVVGLGVMGKSLAKNMLSKKFSVSVYNRHVEGKEVDIAKKFATNNSYVPKGFDDMSLFVNSLQTPKVILLMVNAGKAVDLVIEELLPLLEKGDCIIDGGNSHFKDTIRREKQLTDKGISFIGAGVSGGEEGALLGPSIMPGGTEEGYQNCKEFLEAIAAKDNSGNACCNYIGPNGSGHFVKMIHNGIEYAEMQLIAEIYHMLRYYIGKTPDEISEIFNVWRKQQKDSYLLEITANILLKKEGDQYLIDKVLDKAGQKGTGGWSTVAALELGTPLSTISEAVMARCLSAKKDERVEASKVYQITSSNTINDDLFLEELEKAFYFGSIVNHAIGFDVLKQASSDYNWNLNFSEVARVWTKGCIIRSDLMEKIVTLFGNRNDKPLLMFSEIVQILNNDLDALVNVVSKSLKMKCPLPILSASTNYFLNYTSAQMSANIIQAQRDYFGAHTYQRNDKAFGEHFHTDWKKL